MNWRSIAHASGSLGYLDMKVWKNLIDHVKNNLLITHQFKHFFKKKMDYFVQCTLYQSITGTVKHKGGCPRPSVLLNCTKNIFFKIYKHIGLHSRRWSYSIIICTRTTNTLKRWLYTLSFMCLL